MWSTEDGVRILRLKVEGGSSHPELVSGSPSKYGVRIFRVMSILDVGFWIME